MSGIDPSGAPAPDPPRERALGQVVLVEDEPLVRRAVARSLDAAGFRVEACDGVDAALAVLAERGESVDIMLTDVFMPGKTGFDLLSEARSRWPELPIVLMTGQATVSAAVEAMRLGAYDYLVKPVDPQNTLIPAVRRAIQHRRLLERNRFLERQLAASHRVEGLVGDSRAMQEVSALISAAAPADVTVLILGESGTGKELVARAIHQQSSRSGRVCMDVNCAALTESLLESELFGHVKGAFTGATSSRRGLFETASGGTLFLDEVGELSPATQARLLRVLQEGVVRPVGSSESRRVDVRLIAATNRDLAKEVEAGRFRQDLFYRLNVLTIEIPPLRDRRDDVPALVDHFLWKYAERFKREKPEVSAAVLERFLSHDWPGNVRELENVVERCVVLCRTGTLTPELLPQPFQTQRTGPPAAAESGPILPLADAREAFVRRYVQRLLDSTHGNISEAARIAGVDPSNFRRLIKRLEGDTDSTTEI